MFGSVIMFYDQNKVCCWLEGDSGCSQFIFVICRVDLGTISLLGSVGFYCVIIVVVVVIVVVITTIIVLIDFHVLTLQRILSRRKHCFWNINLVLSISVFPVSEKNANYVDDWCLGHLLQGMCYRCMNKPAESLESLLKAVNRSVVIYNILFSPFKLNFMN